MDSENIIQIYNRTYSNCIFYYEKGDNRRLLNEIGTLRGIVYCIAAIVGEGSVNNVIDFPAFAEMIDKQNELLEME